MNAFSKSILNSVNKENFQSAALSYSISDSSNIGGELGWIKESSLNNTIKDQLKKLNIGDITNPIFTPRLDQTDINSKNITKDTALLLKKGKVIGWFQGRMELGPRALGNRSILGDPRRSDMKDILNLKIKRRESFRPFAPSILREHVSEWFENDDEVPFMMKVYQIKKNKRAEIPAVTHIDGSGRLQTVYKETNEKYHDLINEFYKLTNIPILLNTSFNENEPIVNKPEEALDCFLRTKMDILAIENYIIERK